ncbi:ribonuclease H-like domain-containing protein [Mycena vulgaris]|nr:ribonuclease H-like domain-containing protein [Mycena vulgaris]
MATASTFSTENLNPNSFQFTFCNKARDLPAIAQNLQSAPTVFLDCEGDSLGLTGGRLSLISLGIPSDSENQPRIYLIDAITLGTPLLRPIFDLLASNDVEKIVFDGRMDQATFFHDHGGIQMQNVVDLQLADIKSRAVRGEDPASMQQLARLSPYLPPNEVNRNPAVYAAVQKLAGLEQAMREHEVGVAHDQLAVKSRFKHTNWCKRPLPRKHLAYAANDIALIASLWSKFVEEGYIDGELAGQSARYARMWTVGTRPAAKDIYKLHALLPLGILDDAPADPTKSCSGCGRALGQPCFSNTAWKLDVERKCLVCRAIGIRQAIRKKGNRKAIKGA